MAWGDPASVQTPSAGATILSAWGNQVRDSSYANHNLPMVRVHRGGTMSLTTGVETEVLFDAELIDTHSMHSLVSNTGRLTVPTGWSGYWNVRAGFRWAANNTGRRYCRIKVNGSTIIASADHDVSGTGYAEGQVSCLFTGAPTDYFGVYAYQDSGGNLDLQNDGYAGTFFEAFFVAAGGAG